MNHVLDILRLSSRESLYWGALVVASGTATVVFFLAARRQSKTAVILSRLTNGTGEEVTPVDRPVRNALNVEFADEMASTRYAVTDWARKFGDLERTVRLADAEVAGDMRGRIADNVIGLGQDVLAGGQRMKEYGR